MAEEARTDRTTLELRLNQAIQVYREARSAGSPLDRDEFLACYPDLATELRSFLDNEGEVGCVMSQLTDLHAPEPVEPQVESFGHYDVYQVINKGGMGIILRCRDRILERELAIKVMHAKFAGRSDLVERFHQEAQIASQLQHPGIAPVHELGTLPDGRPYFSMKLIGGRDLAALLRERAAPTQDLSRFLAIFQQVCQTVAYSHSKNVLHRDLKPLNIMVGEFGEVQVLDWGLGKVITSERQVRIDPAPDERPSAEPLPSKILMVRATRSNDSQAATPVGNVQGTFGYMPPEQAKGETGRIDRRCDVFSLGAILCTILTGKPPYVGPTRESLWEQARQARLEPAFARLDRSGADAELIALAKTCLAADPELRPADAGVLAEALARYLNRVQERLRAAEVERAAAEAKAAVERKKRLWQLGMAAAVLLLVTSAVAGGLWYKFDRERRETERSYAEHARRSEIEHAIELIDQSIKNEQWEVALGVVQRAEGRAHDGRPVDLVNVLAQQRLDIETVRKLEDFRSRSGYINSSGLIYQETTREYQRVFQSYGIDLESQAREATAERIRKSRIRDQLVVAIDEWGALRILAHAGKEWKRNRATWRITAADRAFAVQFVELVQATDPNAWRVKLRAAASSNDYETCKVMLLSEEALKQPPAVISGAAAFLGQLALREPDRGYETLSTQLLQRAVVRHPGDFLLNLNMSVAIVNYSPPGLTIEDALAYLRAAEAVRPNDTFMTARVAEVLLQLKRYDQALRELDHAIGLSPDLAYFYALKARALAGLGKYKESLEMCSKALALDPGDARTHFAAGMAHVKMERIDEAIKDFQDASRLDPDDVYCYYHLGYCQFQKKNYSDAINALRRYTHQFPKEADASAMLALSLFADGRLTEAKTALVEALRLLGILDPRWSQLNRAKGLVDLLLKLQDDPFADLGQGLKQVVTFIRELKVLAKEDASDAEALLELAHQFRKDQKFFASAARMYTEAFKSEPDLAEDLEWELMGWDFTPMPTKPGMSRTTPVLTNRYHAITCALRASAGEGKDSSRLSGSSKARFRKLALEWFRAELNLEEAMTSVEVSKSLNMRESQRTTLEHWRTDPAIAAVRDPVALAKLPEAERQAWQQFWADVHALSKKLDQADRKK